MKLQGENKCEEGAWLLVMLRDVQSTSFSDASS